MVNNHLKFIKQTLYRLKREYGLPVSLIRYSAGKPNFATGVKPISQQSYTIQKCIRMPELYASTSELGALVRHFRFSGETKKGTRQFIIDGKDLPIAFIPDEGCELVLTETGEKYIVDEVTVFDLKMGYLITAIRRE